MASTLIATRYIPPGSYIGQLITPRPGAISDEARIPCFIGRGSRLALGSNLPIQRCYVFAQSLTFSPLAPFVANLPYDADGDQQAARLFKADGTEVRKDQWSFRDSGTPGDVFDQVLIATEVHDATATYFLDYQSTDRDVKDVIPVEELREVVSIGNRVDDPQYQEYINYFIMTTVTDPTPDSGNTYPTSALGTIVVGVGNTGTGTVAHASSSQFTHDYTRSYNAVVTAKVTGVKAAGTITTVAVANLVDGETFTLDDGRNDATVFEFNVSGTHTPAAGNVEVDVSGDTSADDVKTTMISVITGVGSTLAFTATDGGVGQVDLEADDYGSYQNNAIADTVTDGGFSHTGMATGVGREVDFDWDGTAVCPGNASGPNTPYHSSATKPTFKYTDNVVGSDTPLMEYGLRLQLDMGSAADPTFEVADVWDFNAEGPGLFEADIRYGNTNQFALVTAPVAAVANTGTGAVTVDSTADYNGTYNANYDLECTLVSGASPSRTATFVWSESGDHAGINGTFVVDESTASSMVQVLSKGVALAFAFGLTNFVAGDKFTTSGKAPRILYQAKDNRNYTLAVSVATAPAAGEGYVEGTFTTDTPEGSWGEFNATANDKAVTDPDFEDGHFTLPDNVKLAARNMYHDTALDGNRHVAADDHTFAATQEGLLDWSLTEKADETIEADAILTDVSGAVTGTPNTKYVIVSQTPTAVEKVETLAGSTPVSFTWITGTSYVTFASDPGEAIVVTYEWRSAEPDPGQTYYMTGKFLRPPEAYNTPTRILGRQDGRTWLAPAGIDNHLYTMNEIAFDNGAPGVYYIQVDDPDQDGIYTDADFNEAILASEAPKRITDIVVLSQFTSLGAALSSVNKMNDPFERRERLCWVGMPIGTPIGNATSPNTLVYTAANTLQVFGNAPYHGTRVIVGSTEATRDIRLETGETIEITMDGSFVAGGLACLTASFQDPGETILRKSLSGFKTVETYGDIEDPRNLTLGGANVIYLTDRGGSVYRIEEDVTPDTFADDFHNINAMTQKQFVVRNIRSQMDANLVGIVVPSEEAGVGLVRGFVIGALGGLVTRGVVGRFQDENGSERPLDPDKDVVVFRDDLDTSLYHFFFAFWLKTVIKRLFGLYSVNSNDFGLLRG